MIEFSDYRRLLMREVEKVSDVRGKPPVFCGDADDEVPVWLPEGVLSNPIKNKLVFYCNGRSCTVLWDFDVLMDVRLVWFILGDGIPKADRFSGENISPSIIARKIVDYLYEVEK